MSVDTMASSRREGVSIDLAKNFTNIFCSTYAGAQTTLLEEKCIELRGRQDDFCMICLESKPEDQLFPQISSHEIHLCPRRLCETCYWIEPSWRAKSNRFKDPVYEKYSGWVLQPCPLCWKRYWDVFSPLIGPKSPHWERADEEQNLKIQSLRQRLWIDCVEGKKNQFAWRTQLLNFHDDMTLESDRDLLKAIDQVWPSGRIRTQNFPPIPVGGIETGRSKYTKPFDVLHGFNVMCRWLTDIIQSMDQKLSERKSSSPSHTTDSPLICEKPLKRLRLYIREANAEERTSEQTCEHVLPQEECRRGLFENGASGEVDASEPPTLARCNLSDYNDADPPVNIQSDDRTLSERLRSDRQRLAEQNPGVSPDSGDLSRVRKHGSKRKRHSYNLPNDRIAPISVSSDDDLRDFDARLDKSHTDLVEARTMDEVGADVETAATGDKDSSTLGIIGNTIAESRSPQAESPREICSKPDQGDTVPLRTCRTPQEPDLPDRITKIPPKLSLQIGFDSLTLPESAQSVTFVSPETQTNLREIQERCVLNMKGVGRDLEVLVQFVRYLYAEREAMKSDVDSLEPKLASSQEENENLSQHNSTLKNDKARLEKEIANVQESLTSSISKQEDQNKQIERLQIENTKFKTEIANMQESLASSASKQENQNKQIEQLQIQNTTLTQSINGRITENAKLKTRTRRQQDKQKQLEEDRDRLGKEVDTLRGSRDNLIMQLETQTDDIFKLNAKIRSQQTQADNVERNLRNQLSKWRSHAQKLEEFIQKSTHGFYMTEGLSEDVFARIDQYYAIHAQIDSDRQAQASYDKTLLENTVATSHNLTQRLEESSEKVKVLTRKNEEYSEEVKVLTGKLEEMDKTVTTTNRRNYKLMYDTMQLEAKVADSVPKAKYAELVMEFTKFRENAADMCVELIWTKNQLSYLSKGSGNGNSDSSTGESVLINGQFLSVEAFEHLAAYAEFTAKMAVLGFQDAEPDATAKTEYDEGVGKRKADNRHNADDKVGGSVSSSGGGGGGGGSSGAGSKAVTRRTRSTR